MRKVTFHRTLLAIVFLACLSGPAFSTETSAGVKWKYYTETKHYHIYTNISQALLREVEDVAERAFATHARRLDLYNDNAEFIKNLEAKTGEAKFVREYWNGVRMYEMPNGVKLTKRELGSTDSAFKMLDENAVIEYEFELPDGKNCKFWKNSMMGNKQEIYLCTDAEELDRVKEECHSAEGPDRGGWFPADGCIAVVMDPKAGTAALDMIVHEIGHQVLHYIVYSPPTWLDEGIAMYSGVGPGGEFRAGHIREVDLDRSKKALKKGKFVPVTVLVTMGYRPFHFSRMEDLHYSESWALVRFLVKTKHPELKGKFPRYLEELRKGEDALGAFQKMYDGYLVDKELRRYLQKL